MYLLTRLSVTARLLTLSALTVVTVAASGALFGGAATAAPTDPTGDVEPFAALVTEESTWLMGELLKLQPGSRNGGMYDNKPGYHNTRAGNSPDNYSVRDEEDKGGPSDKAAAYDWTFPEAQSTSNPDYSNIIRYSNRLLASGRDPGDPRLNGWKEFFGQIDNDNVEEGYDFRDDHPATPGDKDKSHLWHIHLSEDRNKVTSLNNKKALLSVLRGETVEEWLNGPGVDEDDPARVRADVTGDGLTDLVVLYDYGRSTSALMVFRANGSGYDPPVRWWGSEPGNWAWSSSKLVVGNFNDDKQADVGILYDFGNANTKLFVFLALEKTFAGPIAWWESGAGNWAWSSSKLAVGNFNDDSMDDVAILYDYGNANTKLFVLRSLGNKFTTPEPWHTFNPGNWAWSNSKLVVGDFAADDKKLADIGIMYDYGGATSKLFVLRSLGNKFTPPESWFTFNPGNWAWSNSKLVAGDFAADDNKLTDIGIMYDYGGATSKLFVLRSLGDAFSAPEPWFTFNPSNWAWSNSKITVGNYNTGDTISDIAIMYDYGDATSKLFVLRSTGSQFTAPDPWWNSIPGNWAWASSKIS